jgi:hypothetical protein
MNKLFAILAVALPLAVVSNARAVTIQNFSFESPALTNGDYQGDGNYPAPFTTPGWTSDPANGNGAQNFIGTGSFGAGSTLPAPADGKQAIYVNGNDIYQDVGALLPNLKYTLTVAAGNQPGFGPGSTGTIELVNGTTPAGTLLNSTTISTQPVSSFADFSVTFITGPSVSGDLTIVLAKASGNQMDYDNVRLTATPEPSSIILGGLGAVGLLLAVRRRRAA